jgi:hypothetical protein
VPFLPPPSRSNQSIDIAVALVPTYTPPRSPPFRSPVKFSSWPLVFSGGRTSRNSTGGEREWQWWGRRRKKSRELFRVEPRGAVISGKALVAASSFVRSGAAESWDRSICVPFPTWLKLSWLVILHGEVTIVCADSRELRRPDEARACQFLPRDRTCRIDSQADPEPYGLRFRSQQIYVRFGSN